MTESQIRRLGERIKRGNPNDVDLRLLDEYRASFSLAYEQVVRVLRSSLGFAPTGRPSKTTASIIAKIQREKTRLNRMQDIAGCRLVVENVEDQEKVVESIKSAFSDFKIDDRRKKPSHGYRAVHVIVNVNGRLVEIQVRTALQHLWAEFSEKVAETVNAGVKYGEGPALIKNTLHATSHLIDVLEKDEKLSSEENIKSRPIIRKSISDLFQTFLRGMIKSKGQNDLPN
jgi:putative GTP pyrophosphokinase